MRRCSPAPSTCKHSQERHLSLTCPVDAALPEPTLQADPAPRTHAECRVFKPIPDAACKPCSPFRKPARLNQSEHLPYRETGKCPRAQENRSERVHSSHSLALHRNRLK